MKQSYKTNTKNETNFSLSVFTGKQKIIFLLNLQQNRKNALDKIPEMFVNCKQTSCYKKFLFFIFIPLIW